MYRVYLSVLLLYTGYMVLSSPSPSEPAITWQVRAVPGDKDDVTIQGLSSNVTYYFKVQARNSVGYGPLSTPVNYTTPAGNGVYTTTVISYIG